MIKRRGFLAGLGLLVAPAIIRTPGLLMPIMMPQSVLPKYSGYAPLHFDEIVRETLRARGPQLAANIMANNALFQHLVAGSALA